MTLNTLRVLRHRNRTDLEESVGFRTYVPTLSLPTEELTDEDADVWRKLGWQVPSLAGSRITSIDATHLVEPSRWERLWLDWLTGALGLDEASIVWPDRVGQEHALTQRLTAEGLQPFDGDLPDDVRIRRAETPRGEARAAARAVRDWVLEQDVAPEKACDDVLVLVDGDATTVDLWRREFERTDLPVRADQMRLLSRTGMGAWLLRLARLHDWSDTRKSRELLRDVLLSGFVNFSELGELKRHDVDKVLRRLRRHTVSLDEWLDFLEDVEFDNEREQAHWHDVRTELVRLTEALAAAAGGAVRGLYSFFDRSDLLRGRTATDSDMYALRQAVRRSLYALTRRIAVGDVDIAPEDGADPVLVLREHLAGAPTPDSVSAPRHGVTLLPHMAYDGRASGLLIVSGLGEGQFPVAPAHWGPNEEQWARRVGLLDDEQPAAFARGEIERQIRLICHAIERCSGPKHLSHPERSADQNVIHPGPLLSLLIGDWDRSDWDTNAGAMAVTWADEIPRTIDDARCWVDARAFANDDSVVRELTRVSDRDQARELDRLHVQLAPSRGLLAGRPNFSDAGPYSGRLPGNPDPRDVFSASALEAYGQCPAKYFFSRVLRLRDEEDAADMLDALEVGNLIHAAFFDVAQEQTRPDGGAPQPWKLTVVDGETEDDAVERISMPVLAKLDELAAEVIDSTPSLEPAVVLEATARWKQAVPHWVRARLEDEQEWGPDDVRLDDAHLTELTEQYHAEKVAEFRREKAEPVLDEVRKLRAHLKQAEAPSKGDADNFEYFSKPKLRKGADIKGVLKVADKEGKQAALAMLEEIEVRVETEIEEIIEGYLDDAAKWRGKELKRRQNRANDHLLHAELRFGRRMDDRFDPASIEEPLEIGADGVELRISGSIDRVDYDERSGTLAARDYKTSRTDARANSYISGTYDGTHVQLPLYGLAANKLVDGGHIGGGAPVSAIFGSYEFPAPAKSKDKRMDEVTDYAIDGEFLTFGEVGEKWIASHVENIREGLFTPVPESCPITDYAGYCDYEHVCRSNGDPLIREEAYEACRPAIEKVVEGKDSKPYEFELVLPRAADDGRSDAQIDTSDIVDLDTNVFISAGAGTGKTYNLVRRYVAALVAGHSPRDILCITFTRKAAAEMRDRIRRVLLDPSEDMKQLVEKIGDAQRRRDILIDLSAAPISTIDSLAGDVVRAYRQIQANKTNHPPRPFDVVTGKTVREEMNLFVSERILDGLRDDEPRLSFLAEHINIDLLPKRLREATGRDVREVLTALGLDPQRSRIEPEELQPKFAEQWLDMMAPALEAVADHACNWSMQEWDSLMDEALAQTTSKYIISDSVLDELESLRQAIVAARSSDRSRDDLIDLLMQLDSITTRKTKGPEGKLGYSDFAGWFRENRIAALDPGNSAGAVADIATTWLKSGTLEGDAALAAQVTSVAHQWQREFAERLDQRGMLRHGDVERQAARALDDPAYRHALAAQFPFAHIFVDESQDTSGSQIELIERLRDVREDTPKMFWVGDVKQSIYRFRGAEVDVFERQMQQAEDHDSARVIPLRRNWRSQPALLEVFNDFFGSAFPAIGPDGPLDPGAAIPYLPLTPRPATDKPHTVVKPALEIYAEAGKGFDAEAADQDDEDTSATDPLKQATVRRVSELLEASDHDGTSVAILVHAWNRAVMYRDLLEQAGIVADVQGGKGLLLTPECVSLTNWLDAALNRDKDSALVAIAQGPGVGISRIGLYCMRNGMGADADAPLWKTLRDGTFDADRAIAAWGDLPDDSEQALRNDEQALKTLQEHLGPFFDRVGRDETADALGSLVEDLGLDAHWKSTSRGEQKLANIARFLDLVRGIEEAHGVAPRVVLRELASLREGEDPAAGGLGAGGDTGVVITTYWQAKGREWPHVVLPDLHKTGNTTNKAFGAVRVVERDSDGHTRAIDTVEVKYTDPSSPFGMEDTPLSELLDIYRKANDRAELRRILYVAMTRAKTSVHCTGEFDAYATKSGDSQHDLSEASDWARTLRAGMGVEIDEDGARLHENSPLKHLEANGTVHLEYVHDYLARTDSVEASDSSDPESPTDLESLTASWVPLDAAPVRMTSPSALPRATEPVRPPAIVARHAAEELSGGSDKWLFGGEESAKGTAVHWLMEHWGYGTGRAIDDTLIDEACQHVGLAKKDPNYDRQRDTIRTLVDNLCAHEELVAELADAAERQQLYHELPVSWYDEQTQTHLSGSIDLVWRDGDGALHLLDYKAGTTYPREEDDIATHGTIQKYYPQVAAYKRGLASALGEAVETYGLWFASGGVAVRWADG